MFRNSALKNTLQPENGMQVIARGQVGLYEPRGDYQFIISRMEEAGEGVLQRQFEALKKQLAARGLFDAEHKQPLPEYPRHIGIITSPSGAAIRDILNVLDRRCPHIPVTIYPVAVQGEQAKTEIVAALHQANSDRRAQPCDVLILARGGGSLEDLWAFNEEVVAQAIYDSRLPVISGVGHEIDFTITDFVADQRAPTPSAAAELVSQDSEVLNRHLQRNLQQLNAQLQQTLQRHHLHLQNLTTRLNTQQPESQLQRQYQRLDELDNRLNRLLLQQLGHQQDRLKQLNRALQQQSPGTTILQQQQNLARIRHQLGLLIKQQTDKQQDKLRLQAARLDAYSPLATLQRGYSLAYDKKRRLVKSVKQLKPGQTLTTQLADGTVESTVGQVQRDSF
ncbi:MAG: exodeoxyribonuclease VII large subunit [Thiotrichales bacterium]|nr:MAG: exodeoxyribonuclease VII large subunit [Thiotrichales bacterium]